MSTNIKLSGKFSTEQPTIEIDKKKYPINNGLESVLAFQEAANAGLRGTLDALKGALGEEAYVEIGVGKMNINNIKVLSTGILAAQAGITYEEAAARFRGAKQS
ncbi:hypothetical protein [Paenibacillus pinihumi]|uniref:hypothetical protein n=1 Tax=Paenibacillus pinihumi TaxID=669462 RepID=UPI0003F9AC36|nr:hypothetical protein [Paenibacillus pinihumi]